MQDMSCGTANRKYMDRFFVAQQHRLEACVQATIDGMGARITELLASSQAAGEQGNVDGAQAAAAQADAVKVGFSQPGFSVAYARLAYVNSCLSSLKCCMPTIFGTASQARKAYKGDDLWDNALLYELFKADVLTRVSFGMEGRSMATNQLHMLYHTKWHVLQADKTAFEADAKARAISNSSSRYGQQEVCQISGLIINSEETRVRDHKMGRNYRCDHRRLSVPAVSSTHAAMPCLHLQ